MRIKQTSTKTARAMSVMRISMGMGSPTRMKRRKVRRQTRPIPMATVFWMARTPCLWMLAKVAIATAMVRAIMPMLFRMILPRPRTANDGVGDVGRL